METEASGTEDSQADYQETEYADSSWEVVGEISEVHEFVPLRMEALDGDDMAIDRMFADYGGLPGKGTVKRWHLPEDVAYEAGDEVEDQVEAVDQVKLREAELEQLKKQAFEEGRLAGLEEAVSKNNERLAIMEQRIGEVLQDIGRQIGETLQGIERNAVEFSLEVSRKILDTTVEINPEYIIQIVHEALGQAGTAVIRKVRISPEDMEFVNVMGASKIVESYDESWEFEADPGIKSGCVVETSAGEIDYQLDAAWERVKDNVIKVIR